MRRAQALGLGIAGSVALHAALLASNVTLWPVARPDAAPAAVEVTFRAPAPEPAALPAPTAPPPITKRRPAVRPPPVEAEAEPAREPPAEAEPAIAIAQADGVAEAAAQVPPDEAADVEPSAPPLNVLPRRIDAEYRLSVGPATARQTVVWVNEGGHYTLTSAATATGLTRLFYSGAFVQISRGRITPHGLAPETFWDQRGDKHRNASFDAERKQITVTSTGSAPRQIGYDGAVQDALSLPFQLALTAPPTETRLAYTVFTGKKLRDYAYEVRGEEVLDTALGPLRTLHLARLGHADGRFEIWLAIDRHYLPVRMLRVEEAGAEGELVITSLAFAD